MHALLVVADAASDRLPLLLLLLLLRVVVTAFESKANAPLEFNIVSAACATAIVAAAAVAVHARFFIE